MAFLYYPAVLPSSARFAHNRCLHSRSARTARNVITRCCVPSASSDTTTALTSQLRNEISRLAGDERGLFMSSSAVREELEKHIAALESTCKSFDRVSAAAGTWRLLYTTITILGRRRVRLAIASGSKPGFVRIADITQSVGDGVSVNTVNFKLITGGVGKFEVRARYEVVNDARVDVKLENWTLEPDKMRQVLGENVNILLEIFNPEGWLDITYVDDNLRIGRDHNANIFVLERVAE